MSAEPSHMPILLNWRRVLRSSALLFRSPNGLSAAIVSITMAVALTKTSLLFLLCASPSQHTYICSGDPTNFFPYLIVSWQQRAVSFISNKRQPVLYLELLYIRIVMYYDEFANAGNVVHACRGQERRRQRKRAEMSVRHYCVGIDTQKYLSAA